MDDPLSLDVRKKIYDVIVQHPGVDVSTISKLLKLSFQLVDYHLQYLSHYDVITTEKDSGYKRCYVKGSISAKDKEILGLLRQETPCQIVMFLLQHPFAKHQEILQFLQMSSPRVSYHLRKLVKQNIIGMATLGDKKGYIVNNEKDIVALLLRYRPTDVLQAVRDVWKDFQPA